MQTYCNCEVFKQKKVIMSFSLTFLSIKLLFLSVIPKVSFLNVENVKM